MLCCVLAGTLAACSQEQARRTRGIGVYPGDPDEEAAGTVVRGDDSYRNLALHRAAFHSSSYDYNLTAQLLTDGILCEGPLSYVDLQAGGQPVDRKFRERLIDGKPDSRIALDPAAPTVEMTFAGVPVTADRIEILGGATVPKGRRADGTVTVLGSADGTEWTVLARGRRLLTRTDQPFGNPAECVLATTLDLAPKGTYGHFRLEFSLADATEANLHTVNFYQDGQLLDVLPSMHFASAWRSAGAQQEWVSVDLGHEASFDKLVLHWLHPAASGRVSVSDDGRAWTEVAQAGSPEEFGTLWLERPARGRFVRVDFDGSADGAPLELAELEVFGRGGAAVAPKTAARRAGARQDLSGGAWRLVRASETAATGERISAPDFDDSAWLVATVPGTVFGSYVDDGAVPDPNFADNQLFASDSYFRSPFWYRDTFDAHLDSERQYLHFDGINWEADVFLNGQALGRIEGAFREAEFDVTGILREGRNDLAVLIHQNAHYGAIKEQTAWSTDKNGGVVGADNPTMHATIGWDWIPTVRGRDIGIWDDVYLAYKGGVSLADPFVRTELPLPDTTSASVFASVTLVNRSDRPVSGVLEGSFGEVSFAVARELAAGETQRVALSPAEIPALRLDHPRLWWPKGYGEQALYDVRLAFVVDGQTSDEVRFRSGVRQMTFSVDGYEPTVASPWAFFPGARNERLSLYVNGRRFIGFGGNWGFPELLLKYRGREYDAAVGYHADMNFTMIRNWVGMTADKEFYEACDRHGVMVWQDFWLANPYDGPNPADSRRFNEIAGEYVRRIRNHPSIAIYVGRNEGNPPAEIDAFLREMVAREHPGLYYIPNSAAGTVSGGGPYRAMPTRNYFRLYGHDKMHSERGMPTVMNYENLVRAFGEDRVEPVSTAAHPNDLYGLHDYTLGGIPDASSAQAAESFNAMLAQAFGEPADAQEFAELSQWIAYDGYRAIFESRSEHRRGMLLWMSHPAWPSLVWQTYDYYLEPTAAYFGCKKACEPLHIQWNPVSGMVEAVNYHAGGRTGLTASARLLNLDGSEAWSRQCTLDIPEDATVSCFPLEYPESLSEVYFVQLALTGADGQAVSENFYWRGREEGNLRALRQLGQAPLKATARRTDDADAYRFDVTLANDTATPALMVRLKAVDPKTDDLVLPVLYSDNYFFLMPGERRTATVRVRKEDCSGRPELVLSGFNVPQSRVRTR